MMDEYRLTPTRRAFTRFYLDTPGKLVLQDKEVPINCCDVLCKGLGAYSGEPINTHTKSTVTFFIPWSNRWETKKGNVVWCKEVAGRLFRFGFEFEIGEFPLLLKDEEA